MKLRSPAVSLCLLLGALAGCLGSPAIQNEGVDDATPPTGDDALPTLEATHAKLPSDSLSAPGTGMIQGDVLNRWNESVPGAFVLLLRTNRSGVTDAVGRFGFADLEPGRYDLQVDARNYEAFRTPVDVVVGEVAKLRIRLSFVTTLDIGFQDHLHDAFDLKGHKVIYDEDALEWPHSTEDGEPISSCAIVNGKQYPNDYGACWFIEVPLETPVPPGSKNITVDISWRSQPYVTQVNFTYWHANTSFPFRSVIVPNGQPRDFPILDHAEVDNGHAAYTKWRARLFVIMKLSGETGWNQGDLMRQLVGPFKVKLTANKGVLWSEPPHRHFWTEGPRLVLVDNFTQTLTEPHTDKVGPYQGATVGVYSRDPQNKAWSSSGNPYFALNDRKIPNNPLVPPGTTRLDVTLRYPYAGPGAICETSHKTLAIRMGQPYQFKATMADLRVESGIETPGMTEYHLAIDANETDTFYATASNWMFLMANQGKERDDYFYNECGALGSTFKLSVVAINENWKEDFRLGKV